MDWNKKDWINKENIGKTLISSHVTKKSGYKEAAAFLSDFNHAYIKQGNMFFEATGDIPFQLTEKQWQGIIILALAQVSNAVYAEYKVDKGDRIGWADYLVLRGNRAYLIELKRWRLNLRGSSDKAIRSSSRKLWQGSVGALHNADVSKIFDKFNNVKTIAKIALNIVPLVDRAHVVDGLLSRSFGLDIIADKCDSVISNLEPHPNWTSILIPENGLTEIRPTRRGSFYERHPASALFAHVDVIARE